MPRAVGGGLAAALAAPAILAGCVSTLPHDSLMVSTTPTRANAHQLAGATVQGRIFVYVPASSGITRVSFVLDRASRPVTVESAAPWDLAGTAAGSNARAFDASTLTAGVHRLIAQVRRGTSVSEVTATFTVRKPASTPSPTPSPAASPTPSPTPSPTASPSPSASPSTSPSTSETPAPSPTMSPTPTPTPSASQETFTAASGRPWSDTSPFNTALPANAVLASNSATVAAYLAGGTNQQIANLYDYGWPVFAADASTPRGFVRVTMAWGSDPFGGQSVPIPAGFAANAGTDGHVAVIDYSTGRSYEYWQLHKVDATHYTASWGQVTPNVFAGNGNEQLYGGSSTGSAISGIAGLVRTYEMRAGVINHALAFASNAVTPNTFQFPAKKTDGSNMAGLPLNSTLPEGARIRLDPTIDLAAIPGITEGELAVGRALQKYGAFCVDQADPRLAFAFQNPAGDPAGNPYPGVGFSWDYYGMKHLPWNKLQLMRQWDGK